MSPMDDTAAPSRFPRLAAICLVAIASTVVLLILATTSRSDGGIASGEHVRKLLSGVEQHNVTLGDPAAPNLLVVYADPFCVGCADFYETTLPALIRRDVRNGRLRIRLRPVATEGMPVHALRETF